MGLRVKRKLAKYVFTWFSLYVAAFVAVGGVCILMVRDMAIDIHHLKRESGFISRIYDINNRVKETIFMIQSSMSKGDRATFERALQELAEVRDEVAMYQEEEADKYKHGLRLFLLFQKIQDNLRAMTRLLQDALSHFDPKKPLKDEELKRLESYGYNIQSLVEAINSLHFKTIENLVNGSNVKMYYILFLYITLSIVGIVVSFLGYALLNSKIVKPIIDLADATQKVARGDLSVRVLTDSTTEIGTLYESFNVMTSRLEEHERQRQDFQRELERKVQERTAELRASEESLRRTQDDLLRMEKIATLGQIATTVNHEIKTPLNVLYMNLQLLNRKIMECQVADGTLKKSMLDITSLINNEISRINEIIEEFVKYARFPLPDIKPTQFNETVKGIAEMVAQNAKEAGVEIKMRLDEAIGLVDIDEKKITQALLNLCMNSIQAMPEGGTLFLETRLEGNHVICQVSDTGTGIEPKDLERIFGPFFTKKKDGMGFGLAIVQRIIEDHKGTIECKSQLGKGTTFVITLPVKGS